MLMLSCSRKKGFESEVVWEDVSKFLPTGYIEGLGNNIITNIILKIITILITIIILAIRLTPQVF